MAGFSLSMLIKRILFKLLSVDSYLKLISSLFFVGYFSGILRLNKKFGLHYFAPSLIGKNDYIIDIGANLGYYSILFGRKTGSRGKVFSVEPVTLFRKVLERNIRRRNWQKNITVLPFALGEEDNKKIILGVPAGNKHFRHGLTRVLNDQESQETQFEFHETMMRPESLFGDLERLDYIKCDVEGYEMHIFPQMTFLLDKFHPVIQIETDGENLKQMITLTGKYGYEPFYFLDKKMHRCNGTEKFHLGDILFLTKNHQDKYALLIQKI